MRRCLGWGPPAVALILATACGGPGEGVAPVRVTVPQGATLGEVADTLATRGVISSGFRFRFFARVSGAERELRAGIYDLTPGTSDAELLRILRAGRVATARITVPEGLTLAELAELLEARHGLPADSLKAAAGAPALRERLGLDSGAIEGFLLPETYTLPLPVTAESLVEAMVELFERRWTPAWQARADSIGLSRLEVVTLASIVEGEARHDEERAVIAGVYTNRLRRRMPLQADPTVQYAIMLQTGSRKQRLYFKDYAIRSPYNTYLRAGLPPGPVNNPGLKSIEAALYPAEVPFLYFVATPDGHHRFSRTLAEHNRAMRMLLGG